MPTMFGNTMLWTGKERGFSFAFLQRVLSGSHPIQGCFFFSLHKTTGLQLIHVILPFFPVCRFGVAVKRGTASDFHGLHSPVTSSLGQTEGHFRAVPTTPPTQHTKHVTQTVEITSIMKEKPVAEEIIITAANKQRKTLANRRKNKKKKTWSSRKPATQWQEENSLQSQVR